MYGYLVPSNMFAVVALGYMQQILSAFYRDPQLEAQIGALKSQIEAGLRRYRPGARGLSQG